MRISLGIVFSLLASETASANSPVPDGGYGSAGQALIALDVGGDRNDTVFGATVLPDGRLVLGGGATIADFYIDGLGNTSWPTDFAVARLGANGAPDPSFGNNGRLVLHIVPTDGSYGSIHDVAASGSDGLAFVGSYSYPDSGQTSKIVVGRLVDDGHLDASFNATGYRLFSPNAFLDGADAISWALVRVQADGKILALIDPRVTETNKACAGLVRLDARGAKDSLFGEGSGIVCHAPAYSTSMYAQGLDFLLLPDGKILIAGLALHSGGSGFDMFVTRLKNDGTLDGSFGQSGWTYIAFDRGGGLTDAATTLATDPAGRILVAGLYETNQGIFATGLARLSSEGAFDMSFGIQGQLELGIRDSSVIHDVTPLSDSRIFVTSAGTASSIMLKQNGEIDRSFGTNGVATLRSTAWIARPFVVGNLLYLAGSQQATNPDGSRGNDFSAERYEWNPIFSANFEPSEFTN